MTALLRHRRVSGTLVRSPPWSAPDTVRGRLSWGMEVWRGGWDAQMQPSAPGVTRAHLQLQEPWPGELPAGLQCPGGAAGGQILGCGWGGTLAAVSTAGLGDGACEWRLRVLYLGREPAGYLHAAD